MSSAGLKVKSVPLGLSFACQQEIGIKTNRWKQSAFQSVGKL